MSNDLYVVTIAQPNPCTLLALAGMAVTAEQAVFHEMDARYEFDAPQFHDFQEPSTGACNSGWFANQTGKWKFGQRQPSLRSVSHLGPLCSIPSALLGAGDPQALQEVCSMDVQEQPAVQPEQVRFLELLRSACSAATLLCLVYIHRSVNCAYDAMAFLLQPLKAKKNIVTSWGEGNKRKHDGECCTLMEAHTHLRAILTGIQRVCQQSYIRVMR